MKKYVPYTLHKWSVYVKEWFQERIRYGIPDKLHLIKTNFPCLLICKSIDKKRTRETLKADFRSKGIPFNAYCLTGGKPEDTCVLCKFGIFLWQCYYIEKT